MSSHPSIRDQLEADAWKNHTTLARSLAHKHGQIPERRKLRWEDRALLSLSVFLLLLLILRIETAAAEDTFFGLEFHNPSGMHRMLAMDTDIQVEVTGMVARIEARQHFSNSGQQWAEAIFRFPLPPGAAVDHLRVNVADRVLEGVIEEKKEARRLYQEAKTSGKTASLVEQQRASQFETRLANIGAGESISVTISFLVPVDFKDGVFSLQIPLTFTPRFDLIESASTEIIHQESLASGSSYPPGGHRFTIDIDLHSGISLSRIESRYHDVDIHPSLDGYRIFLANPDSLMDRVFQLDWEPDFGTIPEATLSSYDDGDSIYALLMLAPPLAETLFPEPREVIFVIDTSGSMEGTSIKQARTALKLGLEFLGPDDRFNLVRFSSDSEQLFRESQPAYPEFLQEADSFIDSLSANGGTMMGPALSMAMNLPELEGLLRQVIFITDGSIGNEQELLLQLGEELRDSRLFTVSIGSAPNTWFMRKSAEIGRGSHTHIGHVNDVKEKMSSLWARIENPAIQNICVDWGMDAEFYPEVIPDLYAGEPLWVYARLPQEPREVTVCGELNDRYWEKTSRISTTAGSSNLATLWARSKIEALEDSRIFGAEPEAIRKEAVGLSLEYGLLTRYTSLVAVDKTPRRTPEAGLSSENIPSLMPAGNGMASGFSNTATGWKTQVLLSLITFFAASSMLLYRPPFRAAEAAGARSPMTAPVK